VIKLFSKYTDEINVLRDSLGFDVSDDLLKDTISLERVSVGKANEHTLVTLKFNTQLKEFPEFVYRISREQHDELTERFRVVHQL
jgi:hypothetical protein